MSRFTGGAAIDDATVIPRSQQALFSGGDGYQCVDQFLLLIWKESSVRPCRARSDQQGSQSTAPWYILHRTTDTGGLLRLPQASILRPTLV